MPQGRGRVDWGERAWLLLRKTRANDERSHSTQHCVTPSDAAGLACRHSIIRPRPRPSFPRQGILPSCACEYHTRTAPVTSR